jgi:short-subunit dehydrogenase
MKKDVVFITGASAGVGRAIAEEFSTHDTLIGIFARDEERLKTLQEYIHSKGSEALVLPGDVADPKQLENAANLCERAFGPIDIWINNAMTTVFAPFWEITPEEFKRVTEVTYLGYVYGTMTALKRMRTRNKGKIVQVGSALAYRAIPLQSAYCGAKHAIKGFTDSIRTELIHEKSNIQISMVQMPALNTPQFEWCEVKLEKEPQPVPPIYQPEVAAQAVYWAAYHDTRELNVGKNTSIILWGNKFFPGFGDRYLSKSGYSGQMTTEPVKPDRESNLWHTVKGNFRSHGRFDSRSKPKAEWMWFKTHFPNLWLWIFGFSIFLFIIVVAALTELIT